MSDDFINARILFPSSFQDVLTASQDGPPSFGSVSENKQRLNFTHQTTRDLMCVIQKDLEQVKQDIKQVMRDIEEFKILQTIGNLAAYMFDAITARLPDYEVPGNPPQFQRLSWTDVMEMLNSLNEQERQETLAEMRRIYEAKPFSLTETEFQHLQSLVCYRSTINRLLFLEDGMKEETIAAIVDWYDRNYSEHSLHKVFDFWKSTRPKHSAEQFGQQHH